MGLCKIPARELCPASSSIDRRPYFREGQIEFCCCNCGFRLMDASSALREIGVTILILFLRDCIGGMQRLCPFCLNSRECRGCPLSFEACLCTVKSIAVRPRINNEQEVISLYAVSFPIRNL